MSDLLDEPFLRKLEYLSLVSRRVFAGELLAHRRATQLGGGVEFAEHRPYTTSDDYRHLDWNVYARLGQLLIKRFREEQDLPVYLLLDVSRSMGVGRPSKFDFARRVVAALVYIALTDMDTVSVTAFAGDLAAEYPPTRGKDGILPLFRFLGGLLPLGERTDLARSLGTFVRRPHRRGLAVVVSDWYDRGGFRIALDLLRHHRFDAHVIQVVAPEEEDPALAGDVELVDVETQSRRRLTVNESALERYRKAFRGYREELGGYCHKYGLGWSQTTTAVAFDDFVLRMMREAGTVQ